MTKPKTDRRDSRTSLASCSRIWHGKACGCKTFRYWLPGKGRMSFATPRNLWTSEMREAHCTKCGKPINANATTDRLAGKEKDGSDTEKL